MFETQIKEMSDNIAFIYIMFVHLATGAEIQATNFGS